MPGPPETARLMGVEPGSAETGGEFDDARLANYATVDLDNTGNIKIQAHESFPPLVPPVHVACVPDVGLDHRQLQRDQLYLAHVPLDPPAAACLDAKVHKHVAVPRRLHSIVAEAQAVGDAAEPHVRVRGNDVEAGAEVLEAGEVECLPAHVEQPRNITVVAPVHLLHGSPVRLQARPPNPPCQLRVAAHVAPSHEIAAWPVHAALRPQRPPLRGVETAAAQHDEGAGVERPVFCLAAQEHVSDNGLGDELVQLIDYIVLLAIYLFLLFYSDGFLTGLLIGTFEEVLLRRPSNLPQPGQSEIMQ
eukprot:CAMPEP_0113700510 /NCGR_PEP_ID=MMETSP0038_2-20120614/24006_1 /TAXON_ID=2898 /ORGANISM="Cryptomonas paramecium" /LENGTH=303 /DNA_ID=CAMNT_0000624193 /DNA_START=359 /DNA_END=1267 /DNA_ORIENTATION=- /assembly_acc=CAM_ASM_000170